MNKHHRTLQLAAALTLTFLLLATAVGRAAAFEIRGGDTVTIGSSEVIDDDLFLAGQVVTMDGTVNGDLFLMGSIIQMNGTVNGSLFVGGQTIEINGKVTGSVYGGGLSVSFGPKAAVGRNALFGGYGLEAEAGSAIGRDVLISAYQAQLKGDIGRDVTFGGNALEVDGSIGGDLKAEVEAPGASTTYPSSFGPTGMPPMIPSGLRIGPEAEIGGEVRYTSPVDQSSAFETQPEGGVVFSTPVPSQTQERPRPVGFQFDILNWIFDRIRDFVTLMVLGALAVWLLPKLINEVADTAKAKPLPAAGWGFVVVVIGYFGAVVVGISIFVIGLIFGIVTLGGLSETIFGVGFSGLGLVMTVFTLLVSYGSKLVIAYLIGKLMVQAISPANAQNKWLPLFIGVPLYVIVRAIPFLGWLVGVVVTILGIGAMWLLFRQWQAGRGTAVAVPAPVVPPEPTVTPV